MDKPDLQALLNEKFGEMYQHMLAGDPASAMLIMNALVDQVFEEFN